MWHHLCKTMSMRILLLLFLSLSISGMSNTKIFGSAPNAINQYVYVSGIEDYITNTESIIYTTSVNENGQFLIELNNSDIEEVVIRIKNSYAHLYVQNDTEYFIEFPEESIDAINYFSGSETEILFFNLDSTDINYKILGFEAWMDDVMADLYILKDVEPTKFIDGVLKFKGEVQKEYANDTSMFFKDYVRYSLGKTIDNIYYFGAPSKETKYDFFIKNSPVLYKNSAYMAYINDFYDQYLFQLNKEIRDPLIQSIYNSSASNMLQAISFDSLVPNMELTELVALKIIQQEYNSNRLPKNNLISITNQIRMNTANTQSEIIAENLIEQFYTLIEGDPFPVMKLTEEIELKPAKNRYLYIHFFDPENPNSLSEISALRRLYEKYNSHIDFVTIYLNQRTETSDFARRVISGIKWEYYALDYGHSIWKLLNIGSFPYYILVKDNLQIKGLPALGPTPNGVYETIERTFHDIKLGKG